MEPGAVAEPHVGVGAGVVETPAGGGGEPLGEAADRAVVREPHGRRLQPTSTVKEHGAVYLNAIGGAAQFYARSITAVHDVSLLEFGTPEAMWHLEVQDFPAIVTMDAHGTSLHRDVEASSARQLSMLAV